MIRTLLLVLSLAFIANGSITVTPSQIAWNSVTSVNEFHVKLSSQPTADVVVGVSNTGDKYASLSACSLTFTPSNWNVAQKVGMLARPAYQGGFSASFAVSLSGTSTDTTYASAHASVSITKELEASGLCISWGDPHYTNFLGKKFNFQGLGDYYMVRAKDSSVVIQTRQKPCSSRVTCNFGIAVKYHADILAVGLSDEGLPVMAKMSPGNFSKAFQISYANGGNTLTVSYPEGDVQIKSHLWKAKDLHYLDIKLKVPARLKTESGASGICLSSPDLTHQERDQLCKVPASETLFSRGTSIPVLQSHVVPASQNPDQFFEGTGGSPAEAAKTCTQVDIPESGSVWHSKKYIGGAPASPLEYSRIFHELNDGNNGYCRKVIRSWDNVNNGGVCGQMRNWAVHMSSQWKTLSPSTWCFRLGADLGKGGVMHVDGDVIDWSNEDLWWEKSWKKTGETLSGCTKLAAGEHQLSIYGFEACCDGAQKLEAAECVDTSTWPTSSHGTPPDENAQASVWTSDSKVKYSTFSAKSVSFKAIDRSLGPQVVGLSPYDARPWDIEVVLSNSGSAEARQPGKSPVPLDGGFVEGDTFEVAFDEGFFRVSKNGASVYRAETTKSKGEIMNARAQSQTAWDMVASELEYSYSGCRPYRVWSADNFPIQAVEAPEELTVSTDVTAAVEEAGDIGNHDFGPQPSDPTWEPLYTQDDLPPFPPQTATMCSDLFTTSDIALNAIQLGIDTAEFIENCEFDLRETGATEAVLASGNALISEARKLAEETSSSLLDFFISHESCGLCHLHGECQLTGEFRGTCDCTSNYVGRGCSHRSTDKIILTSETSSGKTHLINGVNFFPEETHYCVFGDQKVEAKFISATQLICTQPEDNVATGVAVTSDSQIEASDEFELTPGTTHAVYHHNSTVYLCQRMEGKVTATCFKSAGHCGKWHSAGFGGQGTVVPADTEFALTGGVMLSWNTNGITTTDPETRLSCSKPLEDCICAA